MDNISVKEVKGNPAFMTNMVEGNITNIHPLTKIRNYYRMGDGILDGYPIIQDQTSPNLAHIPTTNLLYNSEDFSAWQTEGGNQSITPNAATSPIGTSNATKLTVSSSTSANARKLWIYGASPMVSGIVAGKPYAFSVYIKKVSGQVNTGYLHITTGANDTFAASTSFTATDEWQRVSVAVNSLANSLARFYITGDANAQLFIWGGQVEQQAQSTPYIKSENSVFGVRKSSTTNLLPYSEDFSQWNIKQGTETLNYGISPDGTQNSTRIVFSGANLQFSKQLTTGTPSTGSIYVKGVNGETINFGLENSESIFTLNGEWQRIQKTGTATSNKITVNTYGGATARDIQVWGAQLEEQTQAETYAKTTGLPVTIDLFTENNYGTMTNMSASDIVEDTP